MEEKLEGKKRILIVDDDPDFLTALQGVLQSESCEVAVAASRANAEGIIGATVPDLVILGTLTPRGEAFSLHQWLRHNSNTRDLPILVIDAPPEKQLIKGWSRDEAMQMEAEYYTVKPVQPDSLASRAQKVLDKASRLIRVLVVDDHSMVRDGIKAVLALEKDIKLVGEAENGKEAVEKTRQLLPNVVVMDIRMPLMDGLEATKQIYKECPQTRVLMLSQYDDDENIAAAEQVGAYGFIPKRAASSQLLNGIRTIYYVGKQMERPVTDSG